MKKIFALLAVMMLWSGGSSYAQTKSTTSPAFTEFWTRWQAAVAAGDKESVAALTRFPFYFDSNLDKAAFLKGYSKIIDAKTAACFKKAKPLLDQNGGYNVFCGETIYYFSPVEGGFRFTDIGAND